MNFILGYFLGLLTSVLFFLILAYFRSVIEHRMTIIGKQMEVAGPRPKGAILMPESDADEFRREYIAKNKAAGKDTPLEDLQ